jgi:methylenetetrahydrofolate dehydrogenase (NADP+)/methenyltetrahydrofolate cyclohydrolase
MTYSLIDGRAIADELTKQLQRERALLPAGAPHGLATVLVGEDYSAVTYRGRLASLAEQIGIDHRPVALPRESTQDEVLAAIRRLNDDPAVSGILVLRPLPEHLDETSLFRELSPAKDVEAVHPHNAGLLALGRPRYVPSTAASVFHVLDRWLDHAGVDRTSFYHRSLIVVVGRSNNVGKPMVSLAYEREASVVSVDRWASESGRLGWHTRRADVLVVAAGVPDLIRAEHVREGAVVLDVGMNPVATANGDIRMVGDVAFTEVAPRARAITPVPGGIGPVTDVWLLRNTVLAAGHTACHVRAA